MLRHCGIIGLIGGALALPAMAAEKFTPPPGCTLSMTVQMHSCQVANYYSCAGDPAGDHWVSFADGEGEFFLSHTDAETRWVESIDLKDGVVERLDEKGSADHASFSTLLDTGRDDYDFVTRGNDGYVQRFIGADVLTGEKVVIDGVALERCSFEMAIEDGAGNALASRKGVQFISRKLRLFFADTESYENSYGDRSDISEAPVSFAFPGEDGFGAAKPDYDCDMMMTDLSPLIDHPSKEALR